MATFADRFKVLSLKNEVNADLLECPVCLEICKEPSFECRNGHLICGACRVKGNISSCPICRNNDLIQSKNLNSYRAMCVFACSNKDHGCNVTGNPRQIKEHEKTCGWRPTRCYVENCQLKIGRQQLEDHIDKIHLGKEVFAHSAKIQMKPAIMDPLGLGSKKVEKYYFSFDQRLYVVSIEFEDIVCRRIWGKALRPGLVSDRLRIVFLLENSEGNISFSSHLKRVLTDSQPIEDDAVFPVSSEMMRQLRGNFVIHVRFMKINKDQSFVSGCDHYKRNCKLKCPLPGCSKIVSCRLCHDSEITSHQFNRFAVKIIICCLCGFEQKPGKSCERCFQQFAQYFCSKCNLYDDESTSLDIFHCDFCRLCRRKVAKDVEYYHCGTCDICLPVSLRNTHECKYNASKENCSVCNMEMHASRTAIVPLSCGHYVHKTCRGQDIQNTQRCGRCLRSRN